MLLTCLQAWDEQKKQIAKLNHLNTELEVAGRNALKKENASWQKILDEINVIICACERNNDKWMLCSSLHTKKRCSASKKRLRDYMIYSQAGLTSIWSFRKRNISSRRIRKNCFLSNYITSYWLVNATSLKDL